MRNDEKIIDEKILDLVKEMSKTKVEISNLIAECESELARK